MRVATLLCAALLVLARRASCNSATRDAVTPPACAHVALAATVCDAEALLTPLGRARLLRAAVRLARARCGAVAVFVSVEPPALPPSPQGALKSLVPCEFHVQPAQRAALVAGQALRIQERATAEARIAQRLTEGWTADDALVEALRALRESNFSPSHASGHISHTKTRTSQLGALLGGAVIVALCALTAARVHGSGPRWERARRLLARLDDARARARARRFAGESCPICLETLAPPAAPEPNSNATSVPTANVGVRRTPVRRTRTVSMTETGLLTTPDDGATRRALQCGHAFHERCLVRWMAGASRNRSACPVCRTPAGEPPLIAAENAPWCDAPTEVSGNEPRNTQLRNSAHVEDSSSPHSVEETSGAVEFWEGNISSDAQAAPPLFMLHGEMTQVTEGDSGNTAIDYVVPNIVCTMRPAHN